MKRLNEMNIEWPIKDMHMMLVRLFGFRYDFDSGDLERTPERFVKALQEITTPEPYEFTTFPSDADELVVVSNISFVTLCGHHLFPFKGVAHVAYIPDGKIAGLSKLARCVRYHAAGLNVQEELTKAIADDLVEKLETDNVAVIMKAEHMCMTIRGVQAHGALTTTSIMRGAFEDHDRLARQEFLDAIQL